MVLGRIYRLCAYTACRVTASCNTKAVIYGLQLGFHSNSHILLFMPNVISPCISVKEERDKLYINCRTNITKKENLHKTMFTYTAC